MEINRNIIHGHKSTVKTDKQTQKVIKIKHTIKTKRFGGPTRVAWLFLRLYIVSEIVEIENIFFLFEGVANLRTYVPTCRYYVMCR
jgi:hypothetical protein